MIIDILREFYQELEEKKYETMIFSPDRNYTYLEVDYYSTCFCEKILSLIGEKRGRIALYIEHSAEVIISILGILKSGNSFVPISKQTPLSRVNYICNSLWIEEFSSIQSELHTP